MEGAEAFVAASGALEADESTHEVDNVDAVSDLLDRILGDPSHPLLPYRAIRLCFFRARFRAAAAFFFLRMLGLS